jgi:hypothetical protein
MIAAKRVMTVVPVTTVPGISKEDVLVFIIADPVVATFRLCELGGFAAQATPRTTIIF